MLAFLASMESAPKSSLTSSVAEHDGTVRSRNSGVGSEGNDTNMQAGCYSAIQDVSSIVEFFQQCMQASSRCACLLS